jgi:sugar/nucleoside kinase (ribokinase family)
MIDLLTVGDSTIDIYMKINDESVSETGGQICFFHGSKVLVDQVKTSMAGNAVNVAVGAKTLGLKVAVYTELGDDSNGSRILNDLKTKGINTKYCAVNSGMETNVHAVVVHGSDRTIFSHHGKRDYKMLSWPKPKWIYYTSLGQGFESFQGQLVEYLEKNPDIAVAFNPGSIQMREGLEKMRNILRVTDVLLVNREEAIRLVGEASKEALHQKLRSLGPKLTLITEGKNGSSVFDGNELLEMGTHTDDRPILDKTGAGDAFSSGFISALIVGKPLKEALIWGAVNSGNTIKEIGSIHGLTNRKEMERLVKQIL